MVPLLTRSPSVGSKMVKMLKPFCCPGFGARKPLLTLARTKPKRPESSLFIVLPKSVEVLDADRRAQRPVVLKAAPSAATTG